MEYANHLKEYAPAMSEAQVAEEVDRIRKAAVRNHTPEVYKLCYSAVDLTTLSCTDSVESVTEFAGKAVKFYQQFPHLPNVASICIYPPFPRYGRSCVRKADSPGTRKDGTGRRTTRVPESPRRRFRRRPMPHRSGRGAAHRRCRRSPSPQSPVRLWDSPARNRE